MKIQWVSNAREWAKMHSNWVFLFVGIMGAVAIFLGIAGYVLPWWIVGPVGVLSGAAGIAVRLMRQYNLGPSEQFGLRDVVQAAWDRAGEDDKEKKP